MGCSARILAAVFYFVDREGEGGREAIYAGSKIVSPPRRRVNKLSIIYRSLDVPRDCSGLIADLIVNVCVCITVLLVPGNDWTCARVDPV